MYKLLVNKTFDLINKKFSSFKIKIWFEPMFFFRFFGSFYRCGSAAFPNFRGGTSLPCRQAIRAMIGEAVAFDRFPAMTAFKIFHAPSEGHCAPSRNRTYIFTLEGCCSIH